jgi:hypothetical protein
MLKGPRFKEILVLFFQTTRFNDSGRYLERKFKMIQGSDKHPSKYYIQITWANDEFEKIQA